MNEENVFETKNVEKRWYVYLSGEIHTNWRDQISEGIEQLSLPITIFSPASVIGEKLFLFSSKSLIASFFSSSYLPSLNNNERSLTFPFPLFNFKLFLKYFNSLIINYFITSRYN